MSAAAPVAGGLRAWVLATRPATLTVAAVPVLVGTALAYARGGLRAGPALAALLGALWIQVGTNLVNDVADFERGADTPDRLGPTRATQAGLLSARQVRRGAVASFALACVAGAYLAAVAGLPVVLLGVVSIAAGVAYTAGPYPLGYHGLGDVAVFAFFGVAAVGGTVFVQLGAVPALALWCAVPVGALATAVLVVNNVRDHATDVRAGKRTLVARLGRRFGVAEYWALLALAYLTPAALWALGRATAWVLLPLATLPLALALGRTVARVRGAALNACLAGTARLLMAHGVLFAAGLAAGAP